MPRQTRSKQKSQYMRLANKKLTVLPPLSSLDIVCLDCSHNMLVGKLPTLPNTLRELNCSYNNLDELPSLEKIILKKLLCSDNQLTILPQVNNFTLTELDCSDNLLCSIPSEYVENLTYLCCANNKLTELPNDIEHSTNLEELYCYNNKLTKLPILPDTLLELHCQHNLLTILPPIFNSDLEVVDCSHNQLTKLPIIRMKSCLKKFNASHNCITRIEVLNKKIKWSIGNNPIKMDCLLHNKHLVRYREIRSLNLVEKHPLRKCVPVTFDLGQYVKSFLWLSSSEMRVEGIINPCREVKITLEYQNSVNKKMLAILIEWLADITVKFKYPVHYLVLACYLLQYILQVRPNTTTQKLQLAGMCAAYYAGLFEHWYLDTHADSIINYMHIVCDSAYLEYEIYNYMNDFNIKQLCSNLTFDIQFRFNLYEFDDVDDKIKGLSDAIMKVIID